MKEEFRKRINSFESEVFHANTCNEMFFDMAYNNRHRDEDWEKAYSIAPAFFAMSRSAIQDKLIMIISRCYEKNGRTDYNLRKIINYAQTNAKKIDSEKVEEINELSNSFLEKLDEIEKIAEKFLYVRDKVIAHNGKEHFLEQGAKNYPPGASYDETVKIIKFGEDVLNQYNKLLFDSYSVLSEQNDIQQLMSFCLKK